MPLDDILEELRTLPGDPIQPPAPADFPYIVGNIQAKLLAEVPSDVNAALVKVAATREGGGNAAFVVRTLNGWNVMTWVGTESWDNPKLTYGVSVEKTWTW